MKVLLLVTLFTLCSAQEGLFKDILEQLESLSNANDFKIGNDTQLHSLSEKHPCECEVVFVQNLNKSIGLINSTSHKDHLFAIMDMVEHLNSPKDLPKGKLEAYCEKKIIRRKRASKLNLIKIYVNSSIAFIKKWNKFNCKKNSAFKS